MSERGARHDCQRHHADGADRPRVGSRTRRQQIRTQCGEPGEKESERNEAVADVEGQHEPIGQRAVAGPSGQPDRMRGTSDEEQRPGDDP